MHTVSLALQGAWKVLLVGTLLGAGLPLVFAMGIRSLAFAAGGDAEVDDTAPPHPAGKGLAALCFGVVLVAVGLGITYIVASGFGKALSFEHLYPILVDKG